MENPFKGIQNKSSVSKDLRNRVLDDIFMIKSTLEFNNFILEKYPQTLMSFIKSKRLL